MPVVKLTKRFVERTPAPHPSGKQQLYWDEELSGFGMLVSGVTDSRTFIVQRDIKGKTRRVTIGATNVLDIEQARERAKAVLADFYQGKDPKAKTPEAATLRQTLEAYLAARKSLSEGSVREYRRKIETHLASWLDLPLRDITAEMVEVRHRAIPAEVPKRYSGTTAANLAMKTFSLLWNFASERDPTLPRNPVLRLKRQWYPTQRRTRHVKQQDMAAFYAAVCKLESAIARDWLLLMLYTGLRRRESAALQWEHVDFGAKVISVPASLTKNKQQLDLPMTTFVHDLLKARRALGNARYIFPANSKVGHIVDSKHALQQVAKLCGIVVSAHDLRRSFCTVAESCDISYAALKQLVNHSMRSDVTAGYIQLSIERLRIPAQLVCDKLMMLCQPSRDDKVVALRN